MNNSEWRKSSYSPAATNCVEVALNIGVPGARIRDSKQGDASPQLGVSREASDCFLRMVTGA